MKKLCIALAAVSVLASCSKQTETTTATATPEMAQEMPAVTQAPSAEMPMVENSQELAAKAKANPLTTVVLNGSHYDFGKIKKGDKVEHTYEISNTGDKPLIISAVKPGCGCTAPTYTKEPIMPGQKGKVTLSFDSSSFDGMVHKEAEVFANVDRTPIVLTFTADIQNAK